MVPKFLVRYADDWIIQTKTGAEAQRLLRWLKKYFKHRLHLELSEEKTVITDARESPIKFLGTVIRAIPQREPIKHPGHVGIAMPNPERVKAQTRGLRDSIRKLKTMPDDDFRATEVEHINSQIVGIAEYWKSFASSRTLRLIDHRVYQTARATFRYLYGRQGHRSRLVPLKRLANRPQRHKEGRSNSKTWAVPVSGMEIGLTLARLTPIDYARGFNQTMTPYTPEGRALYKSRHPNSRELRAREPLYDKETLVYSLINGKSGRALYNFEYMMNREYAWNQALWRQKGHHTCYCCNRELIQGFRQCHHKNPSLPLDKVNKVANLVWLCSGSTTACHHYVEHGIPDGVPMDPKRRARIQRLREIKFGS